MPAFSSPQIPCPVRVLSLPLGESLLEIFHCLGHHRGSFLGRFPAAGHHAPWAPLELRRSEPGFSEKRFRLALRQEAWLLPGGDGAGLIRGSSYFKLLLAPSTIRRGLGHMVERVSFARQPLGLLAGADLIFIVSTWQRPLSGIPKPHVCLPPRPMLFWTFLKFW